MGVESFDHRDEWLAALGERQDGAVGRTQLLRQGFGRGGIQRRLASGHLQRVRLAGKPLQGVYAVGRPGLGKRGRQWAAHLAAGDRSVAAGRTSADRLGLLISDRLEVVVPPDVAREPAGVSVRRLALHLNDITEDDAGMPVLTWARTCLDLAAVGTPKDLRIALDRAVTLGLFDLATIHGVLTRHPRGHGTPALRRALEEMTDHGDLSERGLEDDLLELVLGASRSSLLPRPEVNRPVLDRYRGDLVWSKARVIVEADSRRWHDGPLAQRDDAERQADLEAAGWLVLRVTWRDVHRYPERTTTRILAALDR